MKYCKVIMAGLASGMLAGCSLLPTDTSSRSAETSVADLFISDNSETVAVSEDTRSGKPAASGLRVRKSKRGNMESYVVRGQRYYTLDSNDGYSARGLASWYGPNFHGRTTSNGEIYDMYQMTAAHKTLPLPTYARVTHIDNGKSVIVKINDRGPFSGDRIIDMSFASALELGMVNDGTAMVEIRALTPEELVVMSGPGNSMNIDFDYGIAETAESKLAAANEPAVAPASESQTAVPQANAQSANVKPETAQTGPADGDLVAIEAAFHDEDAVKKGSDKKSLQESAAAASAKSSQEVKGLPVVVVPVATVREETDPAAVAKTEKTDIKAMEPLTDGTLLAEGPADIFPPENMPVRDGSASDDTVLAAAKPDSSVPVDLKAIAPVTGDGDNADGDNNGASAVAQKAPAAKSDSGYYIQAGVYADVGDAERMAVDVVLAIPEEEVHVKPLKDSQMYRVTVGPIIQNQHAQQVSSKLNEAGIENYSVRVNKL